jgi:hypothetical protein
MLKSRLQLRAFPMIVAAYLIAPLVTVSELWLLWYGPWAVPTGMAWPQGGQAWALLLLGGVPVCLLAELVFATPLLVGFSRRRWWWLNGWTACALGFLIAFLPIFALDTAGPVIGDTENGVVFAAHGVRTAAGWISLLRGDAPWGLAGFTMALTFRLIAVRTIEDEMPAPAPAS